MKYFWLFLFLFTFTASFAGNVVLNTVSIEVHKLNGNKMSFMFCELGACKPIGNPAGYDLQSFENMNKSCKRKRRMDPILSSVLSGASFSALALLSSGTGSLVFIAGQGFSNKIDNSMNYEAVSLANDLAPSLVKNKGTFEFLFRDFVLLHEGLQYCHNLYDSTPFIWLEDCDRDIQCKRNLAKSLQWSNKRVKETSAYEIFMLKTEQESAERNYNSIFGEISQ